MANVPMGKDAGGVDKATAEKRDKEYAAAKAEYEKAQDDKAKKDAYVKAAVAAGDAYMNNSEVDIKVKYRTALKYYREAVKVDPGNTEAKGNIDLIEGIYRDMGRPIPE